MIPRILKIGSTYVNLQLVAYVYQVLTSDDYVHIILTGGNEITFENEEKELFLKHYEDYFRTVALEYYKSKPATLGEVIA